MSLRVCPEPGCPVLTKGGRCPAHSRRNYGAAHQSARRQAAPAVATGTVLCARCHKPIRPGEPWHMDHTEDRTGYLGPSHARCDSSAAGRASHGGGG